MRIFFSLMFCLCACALMAGAQDVDGADAPIESTAEAEVDTSAPVAVPEPSDQAMQYYRSGVVIWLLLVLWGLFIPAVFLFTGFSARMRDWARGKGRPRIVTIFLYLLFFQVITMIIDLPISYYTEFVRQHAYDLSNQTFGKWARDTAIAAGLIFVIVTPLIYLLYVLLEKFPKRWWLLFGLGSIPFIVVLVFVTPLWIDPLFNNFHAMEDTALESRVLELADNVGIEGSRIFVVDKSEDTKTSNAYVTGFMNTKRVVYWDTILNELDEDEIMFVTAHEMGHYVLKHVWKSMLFISLLIIASLFAVHLTAGYFIRRYKGRFGFEYLSDIASLPLLILITNVFAFGTQPLLMAVTRYQEHEADRFGVEATRLNHAAATSFVKLQSSNLGNPRPHPLDRLWRSSHPTIAERIEFFNAYRPWEEGEDLRYEIHFKNSSQDEAD